MIKRFISLIIRKRKMVKKEKESILSFNHTSTFLGTLPSNNKEKKGILLIRLDDIGDYFLFRNFLTFYSTHFSEEITFLGNESWKELYNQYDNGLFPNVWWINKKKWAEDSDYKKTWLQKIREQAFSTTISPERTRELNLNDVIVLASDAPKKIGVKNTQRSHQINSLSNHIYTALFENSFEIEHEFYFNRNFSNCLFSITVDFAKPFLSLDAREKPEIVCFIGASKKSKKWSTDQWIDLITLIQQKFNETPILLGGKDVAKDADYITKKTRCLTMVGTSTLVESIEILNRSKLLITNDSFALHAGVALTVPNIVTIANGNNAFRFTEYDSIYPSVKAVYPLRFSKLYSKMTQLEKWFYDAPSIDIQTINAKDVFKII